MKRNFPGAPPAMGHRSPGPRFQNGGFDANTNGGFRGGRRGGRGTMMAMDRFHGRGGPRPSHPPENMPGRGQPPPGRFSPGNRHRTGPGPMGRGRMNDRPHPLPPGHGPLPRRGGGSGNGPMHGRGPPMRGRGMPPGGCEPPRMARNGTLPPPLLRHDMPSGNMPPGPPFRSPNDGMFIPPNMQGPPIVDLPPPPPPLRMNGPPQPSLTMPGAPPPPAHQQNPMPPPLPQQHPHPQQQQHIRPLNSGRIGQSQMPMAGPNGVNTVNAAYVPSGVQMASQVPVPPVAAPVAYPAVASYRQNSGITPTSQRPVSVPTARVATTDISATTIPCTTVVTPAAVGPTTPIYTQEQIDSAWKEYSAPSGVRYYYNSISQASTYEKPQALIRSEATASSSSTAAAAPSLSSSNSTAANTTATSLSQSTTTTLAAKQRQRPWKAYEDVATGKKYYSDGVVTTWEKPADYVEDTMPDQPEVIEPPPKRTKSERGKKESVFNDRNEAIAAFKGLLLAKAIPPGVKWNEVVKMCSSDSRWTACEEHLSTGERKQALAEYQTKRANDLRVLERKERARAKEAFGQMLTEILPSIPHFSARSTRYIDVRSSLSKEDCFYAVEDEETRETLFLEYCEEMRKREERIKRNRVREAHDAFLSFLKEREESGVFTFASSWEVFLAGLSEQDKSDPRFKTSAFMSDSDRQLYFADAVTELQAVEDDKQRRIREARRRAEKAQRDAFRDALRRLAKEHKISPYSRWRYVEEYLMAEDSYGPVACQDRDIPIELFNHFVDDWDHTYRKDRAIMSDVVHGSKRCIAVKPDTTYEDFTKELSDAAAYSAELLDEIREILRHEDPVCSARLYFDELMNRVRGGPSVTVGPMSRLANEDDESSEDEGEIVEDEEEGESMAKSESNGGANGEGGESADQSANTASVPSTESSLVTTSACSKVS